MRNDDVGSVACCLAGHRLQVVRWTAGSSWSPGPGEVRVCVIPLDRPPVDAGELFGCLTTDERVRAERYGVARARQQFVVGRGLLRRMLGDCLGIAPLEVPITYAGAGKPALAESHAGLHFNVTHTDGLALIALARRPVGIDVERVRPVADPEGLVGRFFSAAEREVFLALPSELRPAGFFRGWTCKEAVIKAAGLSVAYLDGFDVELHPGRPAALLAARHPALAGTGLGLAAWAPAGGYAAAVAVEGA
jgi:4'-phosphopantetheinyl transferase